MVNPERGDTHTCRECGTKYYDLRKLPPVCPTCGTKTDDNAPKPGDYWVYVSEYNNFGWEAVVHKRKCRHVRDKKATEPTEDDENIYARYRDENGNYRRLHESNYWVKWRREDGAIKFAKWLKERWGGKGDYKRCKTCFE